MARCLHQWEGPTKLFSEWERPATKRHLIADFKFQEQLQWLICLPQGQDGWPQSISSDGWKWPEQEDGTLQRGRRLSLSAGCIYPSSMPLLILRLSKNDSMLLPQAVQHQPPCCCLRHSPQTEQRIIPALYTQAARSSMLLFNVQSSDWVRIIPLHKVACYITKKELPGLYSSQNITKGGRSSWLVC